MRAILQHGIRDLRLGELPEPEPGPGEALLRTRAVTICASDLHMWAEGNVGGVSWDRPFVPGHEAAGVVEDPNGSSLAPGTPVVVDPAAPCRGCDMCRAGNLHLCRHLKFLDLPPVEGAMRELFPWPADRVFPLPESLDIVEGALLEPMCVAVHAVELTSGLAGATVAVVGCGAIGLLVIQMALLRGARRILAADPVVGRLAVAEALGADLTIPVGPNSTKEEVLRATSGGGADIAFEVAGPLEALHDCIESVRPRGEVVVIGIPAEDEYRLSAAQMRRRELTVRFVRRQNENYPEAISLVREGRVRLGPLLTHRFPAERAQEAFALAERKQTERAGEPVVRVAVTF